MLSHSSDVSQECPQQRPLSRTPGEQRAVPEPVLQDDQQGLPTDCTRAVGEERLRLVGFCSLQPKIGVLKLVPFAFTRISR